MESDGTEKPHIAADIIVAAVYSAILVYLTVSLQDWIHGYLDPYAKYVGGFIIAVITFALAMFIGSFGKFAVNIFVGDRFFSKYFVIFAVVFMFVFCALCSGSLLVWWMSAIMGAVGIVVTFFQKLFKREVKKNVRYARDKGAEMTKGSLDMAKDMYDRFRGKR